METASADDGHGVAATGAGHARGRFTACAGIWRDAARHYRRARGAASGPALQPLPGDGRVAAIRQRLRQWDARALPAMARHAAAAGRRRPHPALGRRGMTHTRLLRVHSRERECHVQRNNIRTRNACPARRHETWPLHPDLARPRRVVVSGAGVPEFPCLQRRVRSARWAAALCGGERRLLWQLYPLQRRLRPDLAGA